MRKKQNFDNWMNLHEGKNLDLIQDPEASASWNRSFNTNIDYNHSRPQRLTSAEIERTKKIYKRLMVCSDWVINHLVENGMDEDMRVLLFSKDGILLRIYGAEGETDWLTKHGIKSGTKWTEESIGTNVFSLGSFKQQPCGFPGFINYSRALIDGAYYYAPICENESDIYAGIVIAVPVEKEDQYIRSVALTAARCIELDMFLFQSVEMFTSSDEDAGSVFLKQDGSKYKVVLITDQVFGILGIKKTDTYHLTLDEIIHPLPENKEFWSLLNNKKCVSDKPIQLSVKGGRAFVNITTATYKQNRFHPDGITVFFNSTVSQDKDSTKYSDNNAKYTFNDIIGDSQNMVETVKRCKIASLSDSNILIQGESGVGKDVLAQAIHNSSPRNHRPFVAINCASFSKELIASELFGYESGAFTGAKREGNIGKFELANHGTLFLDEIGDMPMEVQAVLLRVLEEKTFRRVGGNKLIEVDVRIIAATNRNLKELIEQKQFREDLFYRLSVIRINIPPLRNRGSDVYLYADFFIRRICERLGRPNIKLTDGALNFLGRYSWPGNIRELQNLLEGIITTHEESIVSEKEISNYLGEYFLDEKPQERFSQNLSEDAYELDEKEKMEIALKKCRNNKTKAAEQLGMSRSTFYRRMQEFGML